jgi:hypothetical protein
MCATLNAKSNHDCACRIMPHPQLCKIMAEHEDDVLFLKVSFEKNKDMCKTMGVKVGGRVLLGHACVCALEPYLCRCSCVSIGA